MTVEATDGLYVDLGYVATEQNGLNYFVYVAEAGTVLSMSSTIEAASNKIAEAAASINSQAGLSAELTASIDSAATLSITTNLIVMLNKVAINRIVWAIPNESRLFVIQKES